MVLESKLAPEDDDDDDDDDDEEEDDEDDNVDKVDEGAPTATAASAERGPMQRLSHAETSTDSSCS